MPARAKLSAMNVPIRKPWTQEQFFSWAEAQEARYEFDGFQPVAMTGGNVGHNRVLRNLQRSRWSPSRRTLRAARARRRR